MGCVTTSKAGAARIKLLRNTPVAIRTLSNTRLRSGKWLFCIVLYPFVIRPTPYSVTPLCPRPLQSRAPAGHTPCSRSGPSEGRWGKYRAFAGARVIWLGGATPAAFPRFRPDRVSPPEREGARGRAYGYHRNRRTASIQGCKALRECPEGVHQFGASGHIQTRCMKVLRLWHPALMGCILTQSRC